MKWKALEHCLEARNYYNNSIKKGAGLTCGTPGTFLCH